MSPRLGSKETDDRNLNMPRPDEDDSQRGDHGTVLESVAEFRQNFEQAQATRQQIRSEPAVSREAGDDTVRFRPTQRPSVAVLKVLDDSGDEGETIRIRRPPFVIGRTDGDLLLPHDSQVSSRHAELVRRDEAAGGGWMLRDLGSTNGTFARVSTGALQPGQILLLGGRRYRFEFTPRASSTAREHGTAPWSAPNPGELAGGVAALVEISAAGDQRKFALHSGDNWIGRDGSRCGVVLDDPMVSPRHARLRQDASGRWTIENSKSLNGLWIQVVEVALGKGGYFQIGEQRFAFKIS